MTTTIENPVEPPEASTDEATQNTTEDINDVNTALAKPALEVDVEDIDESTYAVPRGTLAFVLLMITFYILYWLFTWFEVFVIRGA